MRRFILFMQELSELQCTVYIKLFYYNPYINCMQSYDIISFANSKRQFTCQIYAGILYLSMFMIIFLLQYRRYELKDIATKKVLNFRLCDTVGFQEQFAFDSQEFAFILCGNLPDCYQVNYSHEVIYYAMSPLIRDVFALVCLQNGFLFIVV